MSLTLDVDGKKTAEPGPTEIVQAFESLDKKPTCLLKGPGLSMIILARKEAEEIMAVGTYNQGFVLTVQDCPEYNLTTDLNQPVPVGEVIRIFQSYARNEDWGQSKFKWQRFDLKVKTSNVLIRLLIIGLIAFAIIRLVTHFL